MYANNLQAICRRVKSMYLNCKIVNALCAMCIQQLKFKCFKIYTLATDVRNTSATSQHLVHF